MTFWSDKKLRIELAGRNIIDKEYLVEEPTRFDGASFQLSVGEEVYVSPTDKAGDWSKRTKVRLKAKGDDCVIPPGQFAFILTEEEVRIPPNVLAFISVRSTQKFRGLVNVSGFHVDPTYQGKLIFAVYNAGPAPIHVARGDRWFLIFFADLDQGAEKKENPGHQQIPTKIINPIAGHVMSFEGLASEIGDVEKKLVERMNAIERETAISRWATAIVLAGLIAIGVRIFFPQTTTPIPASRSQTEASETSPETAGQNAPQNP
jgi:dCTP deaminase